MAKTLNGLTKRQYAALQARAQMIGERKAFAAYKKELMRASIAALNETIQTGEAALSIAEHISKLSAIEADAAIDMSRRSSRFFRPPKKAAAPFSAETIAQSYILRYGARKVQDIARTTRSTVQTAIAKAIAEYAGTGKTAREILADQASAAALKKLVDAGIFPNIIARALTIARTETAAAFNFANQTYAVSAADELGQTAYKEWIATESAETRPAHAEASGQRVKLDEPFTVGGEELQYPSDPNGSAENVINCRCKCLYYYE